MQSSLTQIYTAEDSCHIWNNYIKIRHHSNIKKICKITHTLYARRESLFGLLFEKFFLSYDKFQSAFCLHLPKCVRMENAKSWRVYCKWKIEYSTVAFYRCAVKVFTTIGFPCIFRIQFLTSVRLFKSLLKLPTERSPVIVRQYIQDALDKTHFDA